MNCPYCKIPSMAIVRSGEVEVDRCRTCGAAWFDPGAACAVLCRSAE